MATDNNTVNIKVIEGEDEGTTADKHIIINAIDIKQNDSERASDLNSNLTNIKNNESTDRILVQGWTRFRITVEPVLFCIGFAINFTSAIIVDLIENNICQNIYRISQQACFNMTPEMRVPVDSETATLTMLMTLMDGLFPPFLSLFIGPWSDIHGRKLVFIMPVIGYAVCYSLYGIFSLFSEIPIYLYLIPPAILSMAGSLIVLVNISSGYICDIFPNHELAIRFSIKSGFFIAGGVLGSSVTTSVFHASGKWGFQGIFGIAFLMAFASILFIILFLQETIYREKVERTNIFQISNVKGLLHLPSLNSAKKMTILTTMTICLICEMISTFGDAKVTYLVGKSTFSWTLGQYNTLLSIVSLVQAIFPVVVLWICKDKLKISNYSLMVLLTLILALVQVLKSTANSNLLFCIYAALFPLGIGAADIWDEEFYTVLNEEGTGKATALFSLLQGTAFIISPFLYLEFYKYLLPSKTLYVYFLSAGIFSISLMGSIILLIIDRCEGIGFNLFENDVSKAIKDHRNKYTTQ